MADQSMFSSFLEDMYKELEKPVATQNLDIFLKKLSDVQANIDKSYAHLKDQLSKGIKIDDSKLEGFVKTAAEATEITNHLNDALKKLSTHKNAQKNFPEQYDKALSTISKMRNVSSNIAQRGQDARYAVHPEEKRGSKEWKEAQRKLAEEQKKEEERIYGKPVDKTTWGKKETPKPEEKQEDKPKEQPKSQEKHKEVPKVEKNKEEKPVEPKKVVLNDEVDKKSNKSQEEKIESLKSTVRDGSSKENAININDKIKELRKEVSELEKKAYSKFDAKTGEYIKNDSVSQELEQKKKELQEFVQIRDQWAKAIQEAHKAEGQGVSSSTGASSYDELVDKINRTKEAAQELATSMQSGQSIDYGSDKEQLDQLLATIKELEKEKNAIDKGAASQPIVNNYVDEGGDISSYQDLINVIDLVKEAKDRLAENIASGNSDDFDGDIAQLKEYESALKELEALKKRIDNNANVQNSDTESQITSYQDLENKINLVKDAREKLIYQMQSGQSDNFEEDIAKLKEYESALKELEALKKNIDKASNPNPQEYDQSKPMGLLGLLKETVAVKAKLAGMKTAMPFSNDMQGTQQSIKNLSQQSQQLKAIWDSMKSSPIIKVFSSIKDAVGKLLSTMGSGLWNGAKAGMQGLATVAQTTLSNMKKLAVNGFGAVKNGISSMHQGLSNIKSKMHSLAKKTTPNVMKTLQSFKSMMMRRLKRTFISAIFNQAKEGIQELAKHSQEFNQAMSSIKNASKEVAGNLAVTLGSLLTTIAPMLQTILDWFNRILIAFNSFLAMLQGKGSVTVAKQNTDDYAKSLKNASKNAKDLNHQLYGFDEITRQEDNSSNGGSKIGYTEQAVDDRFKDIFNMFKEGKFFEIGKLIGNKISEMAKTVTKKIKELRPVARQWARNIAQLLNGIIDTDMFESLGEMVGEGLNLIFDAVYNFLDEFDAKNFGKKLADGFTKLFSSIEWDLVGKTLGTGLSKVWQTVSNFVNNVDWGDIGSKISEGITSFFNALDFEAWRGMVSGSINGLVDLLTSIVTQVDWDGMASEFFENLKQLFEKDIDWDAISDLVSTSINTILDCFDAIIDTDFFTTLASKLGTTVGKILKDIDWNKLVEDIGTGLSQLRSAFWELISKIDLPSLAVSLGSSITGLFDNEEIKKGWEESRTKAAEGINSIISAFHVLINGDENGEGKINFVGIAEEIGSGIASLLSQIDLPTLLEDIGSLTTDIATSFFTLIGKIFEPVGGKSLGDRLAEGINGIFRNPETGEVDTTKFAELGKSMGTAITNILTNVSDLLGGIDWEALQANLVAWAESVPWTSILKKLIEVAAKFIGAALKAAGALLSALITAIKEVDWSDVVKTFFEVFARDVVNVASDVGKSLSDQIVDVIFGEGTADKINHKVASEFGSQNGITVDFAVNGMVNIPLITVSDNAKEAFNNEVKEQLKDSGYTDVEIESIVNTAINTAKGDKRVIDSPDQFWAVTREIVANQVKEKVEYPITANPPVNAVPIINLQEIANGNYSEAKTAALMYLSAAFDGTRQEFEDSVRGTPYESTVGALGDWVSGVFEHFQEADDWEAVQQVFKDAGINLTDEFSQSITGKGKEDVSTALLLLGSGISQDFLSSLNYDGISERLNQWMEESGKSLNHVILYIMAASGQDITEMAKTMGIDVGSELGSVIPDSLVTSLGLGEEQVKTAKTKLVEAAQVDSGEKSDMSTSSEEAASGSVGAFTNTFEQSEGEVGKAVEKTTDPVKEKYEALPDEVKPYADKLIEYVVAALSDGDGTVTAAIEAVAQAAVDRAKEILSGDAGIEIATTFLNGIYEGMDGTSIYNHIESIATTTRAYAESVLSTDNGHTIGANLIVGMINGMNAYGQTLVDTIAHICNVSADTARDILGIASPSKVFAQIGSYTMEGMQIGLENTGKDAINTVSDIANTITKEGKNADLNMAFGDVGNGLDATTDKLARIAQIFSDIASTIADMGGLQIPTVASGQVIPYRTKIADSMTSMSGANESNIEDAIYNAFSRAMTGSDSQQAINITLMIDGRKLTDIVTKYQRQQQRAWGV